MKTVTETKFKKNRLAFTLIDAVVGMGVLGIVMISLFGSFTFGFSVVKLSRDELRATQLLQEKMETIRLYNWNQINQPNFVKRNFEAPLGTNGPVYFSGKVTILDNTSPKFPITQSYGNNMRLVNVSLEWTNNNVRRTRETSTFVSRYGLQNYVY
ncbi:MAG: hypothetical protein ABIR24_01805 [Verrucomicrobiota bacterium]